MISIKILIKLRQLIENRWYNEVLNRFPLFNILVVNVAVITHIEIALLTSVILQVIDSISVAALALIYVIVRSLFIKLMAARTYQNILWSLIHLLQLAKGFNFQKQFFQTVVSLEIFL